MKDVADSDSVKAAIAEFGASDEVAGARSAAQRAEMQQRGTLIRGLIPAAIHALLPSEGTLPFTLRIEGSDGRGRKARVPWVRVYSEAHSPRATNGWYVGLLPHFVQHLLVHVLAAVVPAQVRALKVDAGEIHIGEVH
jgi:hypothetical protein